MKEFDYPLAKFLTSGLRPEARARKNLPVLSEAIGVRATSDGLVEPENVYMPFLYESLCFPLAATTWTYNDWTYDSGTGQAWLVNYTGTSDLEQDVGIKAGRTYRIYFSIRPSAGGASVIPMLNATTGTYHSAGVSGVNSYAETIVCPVDNPTLIFEGTGAGAGSAIYLDDITLESEESYRLNKVVNGAFAVDLSSWTVGPNWTWTNVGLAQGYPGVASKSAIGSSTLTQTVPEINLTIGRSYRVSFSIPHNDDEVNSWMRVSLGTNDGIPHKTIGRHAETIECTGNIILKITANNNGALQNIGITDLLIEETLGANISIPQLLRGRSETIAADSSEIWLVDESDLTVTKIEFYDYLNDANRAHITADGVWQFADLGAENWIATNGSSICLKVNKNRMVGGTDKYLIADEADSVFGSVLEHRGRILMGRKASSIPGAVWQALWDAWATSEYDFGMDDGSPTAENYVFWTHIGGGDFLWGFDGGSGDAEDSNLPGLGYDSDWPMFLDMLNRNDAGFMPMRFRGDVYAMKSLGKNVVVYGSDGIGLLAQTSDPTPTFGYEVILDGVGLASRGAVAGDEREHVFVDSYGVIWRLTNEEGLKRLGYQEYTEGLLNVGVSVAFDPQEREYYITVGDTITRYTFILTQRGLTRANNLILSAVRDGVDLLGTGSAQSTGVVVSILRVDMGNRAIKQVQHVDVAHQGLISGLLSMSSIYDSNDGYDVGINSYLGPEGTAFVAMAGIEFKIYLSGTSDGDIKIPDINVAYSHIDSRFRRGLQVNEAPTNL